MGLAWRGVEGFFGIGFGLVVVVGGIFVKGRGDREHRELSPCLLCLSSIWSCDSASPSRSKSFVFRPCSGDVGRKAAIGEWERDCTCGCTVGGTDADRDCNCRLVTRIVLLPLLVLLCLISISTFPTLVLPLIPTACLSSTRLSRTSLSLFLVVATPFIDSVFFSPLCSTKPAWALPSTFPNFVKKLVFTVGTASTTHHSRGVFDTRYEDRLPPSIIIEPLSGELELGGFAIGENLGVGRGLAGVLFPLVGLSRGVVFSGEKGVLFSTLAFGL